MKKELPGLTATTRDMYIADQKQFLQNVTNLVQRLRMRSPSLAWGLDLSVSSLKLLDEFIKSEIEKLIQQALDVASHIDRDLVQEVVAYVGEVIRYSKDGWWQVKDNGQSGGPLVVFPLQVKSDNPNIRYKAIDIYERLLRIIIEGESINQWYNLEIEIRD
ncbi:MAG: hypothetical protein C4288_22775 [Leptolyngbya sp. ERB_1_1]